MSEAIFGLLGALVGALAALGAQSLSNIFQRKEDRRRQRVELLSRFWQVCEELWNVSRLQREAVEDFQASRDAGHTDRLAELRDEIRHKRERNVELEAEAGFIVAQMRILKLDIAPKAAALHKASRFVSLRHSERLHEEHEKALTAFESAASKLVD